MGDLPADRVTPARPFFKSGVDFAGPFKVKSSVRGRPSIKTYLAVFCCFSTKAVHLEVVSDLSTEAFLDALRRFTARRGACHTLYCDNATNFVGAHNQLKELKPVIFSHKAIDQIVNHCSPRGIEFKFIPPRTPHFGGLWEAAVKSSKNILFKIMQNQTLTFEELNTLVIEVEAILNSRPLTQLSTDPNDFTALTPAHFLIGEPLTNCMDPERIETEMPRRQKFTVMQEMRSQFWDRWSQEYIHTLQPRSKWMSQHTSMRPGTLVLVKEDQLPARTWKMGRVIQAIPGSDGHIRVVEIKTQNGLIKRAIHDIAPLPID